jgi:hypothetical protein
LHYEYRQDCVVWQFSFYLCVVRGVARGGPVNGTGSLGVNL